MGNHRMGHRQTQINLISLRVSEVAIVEIQRQPVEIKVIQPLNIVIPSIGVETTIAPNKFFVRGGILTRPATGLGCGSEGVLKERNLNRSFALLITIIGLVGTLQIVFINPIMIIHVNMIID